jgi:hypothetical protein
MVDEVLARAPLLTLVCALREAEGTRQKVAIDLGHVTLELGYQLVDEVLMTLGCFDDSHGISVLREFAVPGDREGGGERCSNGASC